MRCFALAIMAVAAGFNYHSTIEVTIGYFLSPLEDMSHGWLVPFVSLYTLWVQRRGLREAAGSPSWRGAIWVCFFMGLAWFGGRGGQWRMELISLIGLTWAVPYAFWGRGVERCMRFPAAYLLFTVPISSFSDFFTIHLRILSSWIATGLLNGFGLMIEQSGTALFSRVPGSEFNVDVAAPCSGIRSLFAMMALTAAYAYFTQKTLLRKWVLFACSLLIAMVGNIVRIMSICLVAVWLGQDVATGYYHDYSGYVVFLVGVLLMIQAGEFIQKCGAGLARRGIKVFGFRSRTSAIAETAGPEVTKRHYGLVFFVLVVTLGVFTVKRLLPAPTYVSADLVTSSLPQSVGDFTGDVPWFCHNDQCMEVIDERLLLQAGQQKDGGFVCPSCSGKLYVISLGEQDSLPADTKILKETYRSTDGLTYAVTVVVSGRQRGSIHRPELCLPAQGFVMSDARRVNVRVAGGTPKNIRKIRVQRTGQHSVSMIYWFFSKERESCSHAERILLDIWDRSIHNRINRWAMVAVNVSSELDSPESMERLEAFLSDFCQRIRIDR